MFAALQVYDECAAPEQEINYSSSSGQCKAEGGAGCSELTTTTAGSKEGSIVQDPAMLTCVISRPLRKRKAQPQRLCMTAGCMRRRWQSTAASLHVLTGSSKAVIRLLGQHSQDGPAACEESFRSSTRGQSHSSKYSSAEGCCVQPPHFKQ
uniref:Uncharacterized protein n=1 Tax=Tetradesmus obliquus TaxID=3088 RepID=A0A383VPL7_TETOB